MQLEYKGRFPLFDKAGKSLALQHVRGAAFSQLGPLYVSLNYDSGGVMAFDMLSGKQVIHLDIECQRKKNLVVKTAQWQDLEGITVWNLDGKDAPSISGQVHLLMGDQGSVFFFKHFHISNVAEIGFV